MQSLQACCGYQKASTYVHWQSSLATALASSNLTLYMKFCHVCGLAYANLVRMGGGKGASEQNKTDEQCCTWNRHSNPVDVPKNSLTASTIQLGTGDTCLPQCSPVLHPSGSKCISVGTAAGHHVASQGPKHPTCSALSMKRRSVKSGHNRHHGPKKSSGRNRPSTTHGLLTTNDVSA